MNATTTTQLAPSDAGLLAVSPATLDALRSALAAAKAPETRRKYRAAWAAWEAWAIEHGHSPLPATPVAVAAYLAERFKGVKGDAVGLPSLRLTVAAVSACHDLAALKDPSIRTPCASRLVRDAMRGFARQAAERGVTVKQARGLTLQGVEAIRRSLGERASSRVREATTMALVSVMSEAGLRRSEASALTWGDVSRQPAHGLVTVKRSKTDPLAEGAVVAVTARVMADLDTLSRLQGEHAPDAPVFASRRGGRWTALAGSTIGRRVKRACKEAGLGRDGWSSHSGRVGMAQDLASAQAPMPVIARQGRWRSTATILRYTRNQAAAEVLRYRPAGP